MTSETFVWRPDWTGLHSALIANETIQFWMPVEDICHSQKNYAFLFRLFGPIYLHRLQKAVFHCPCWCTMVRHSKLQKQILALYRAFMRAGQEKPGFIPRIRDEFRENARIKKTDVMHIEYLFRRAQRQLEQLKDVNTKQLGSFSGNKGESWDRVKAKCWDFSCIIGQSKSQVLGYLMYYIEAW